MGGGAAMRAAGKISGAVNSSFRGGFPSVPLPEHLTSAACKAKTTRPVAGIFSPSDTPIDASSSTVTEPYLESDDWEFAEEAISDVGEPMSRFVFGGAPTLEEAKGATFELRTALDQAYLSNKSRGGPYVSNSEQHLETKACVTSDTNASATNHVIQAFRLLTESAAAQTVVASIASDPNVWTAVLQNEALVGFLHSQKTDTSFSGMDGSLKGSTACAEIPGYQSPKYFDDDMFDEEAESKNGSNNFFQDIKVRLEEIISSLSGFFQNIFVGPGAGDESATSTSVDKAMSASIMGLAIMVIMVAVLRRG